MVRLTPRAASDAIDGVKTLSDGKAVIAARVRAVPEKGAANKALEKLIAGQLGVSGSSARVISGQTARIKTVSVAGDPDHLVTLAREVF